MMLCSAIELRRVKRGRERGGDWQVTAARRAPPVTIVLDLLFGFGALDWHPSNFSALGGLNLSAFFNLAA